MNEAALARVDLLITVEAKVMFTVLAPSRILIKLDHSNTATSWNGTPAHVVHISNSILHTKVLILIHHPFVKTDSLDIKVIQTLATIGISAIDMAYLSRVDLGFDHVF